ncbi:MAG TPA: EAL domain-containing protein [Burkholderiales bacterium]|nr:EAL domain-containing protein [Burkholderiales bacterium]
MGALPEQGKLFSTARTLARTLLHVLPDPAWVKDASGRYLAVNPAYSRVYESLTRRSGDDIVGRTDFDLFPCEHAEAAHQQEAQVIAARGAVKVQQCLRDASGRARGFDVHRVALLDESGNVEGTVGFAHEVSDRVAEAEQLRTRERELATLIGNLPGMAYRCVAGVEWRMDFVSEGCRMLTGYPAEDFLQNGVRSWNAVIVLEDLERVWAERRRQLEADHAFSLEYRIQHADGGLRWVWERGRVIAAGREHAGAITGFITDITDTRHYLDELVYRATHDTLTGLANRTLLLDHLRHGIAYGERYQRMVAALVLNVDNFKYVNESLGHDAGDELLKEIANRLRTTLRDHDTISRIGADSFAMVLMDQEHLGATSQVMTRLLNVVRTPMMLQSQEVLVTCSVGCAMYPADGDDPETLLRRADTAMHRARAQGRNCFYFYSADIDRKTEERLHLEANLRRAAGKGELFLQYQPQLRLADGTPIGVEALVRWRHPELGIVSPARFIPLAEETDLIVSIGDWVLHEACARTKTLIESGLPIDHVAVNLSARQFRNRRLVARVTEILGATGLDAHHLELEITESLVMHDVESVIDKLKELKALGILLSIDDFGTGYSSLSYLRRFPIDRIKIDQSFTREVDSSPDAAAIARAVIQLGHALGLRVIAEGVESEGQLRFLRENGCDEIQGYIYARPLDPGPLCALLAAPVRLPS